MNLTTTVNGRDVIVNETSVTLGQSANTLTIFYKADSDADINGTSLTYDLFIKHKSSNYRTKLKDDAGADFVITELTALTASTSTDGYVTLNVDSGYTLLDNVTYIVVLAHDNTAGLSTVDLWTQASSI
jgi:hypothetical protein